MGNKTFPPVLQPLHPSAFPQADVSSARGKRGAAAQKPLMLCRELSPDVSSQPQEGSSSASLSQEWGVGGHGNCSPCLCPGGVPSWKLGTQVESPHCRPYTVALVGWSGPEGWDGPEEPGLSQRKPPSCVYSGFWERIAWGTVLLWFLTAAWTGRTRILCLFLPLTQVLRIVLSSVGPEPPPSTWSVPGKS